MAAVRLKSYSDYGVTKEETEYLLSYCHSKGADKELIKECAKYANSYLCDFLYKSVTEKRSYEKLGYVPICKGDFYAYRRKMLSKLKRSMVDKGELVIDGNIWSLEKIKGSR